jgi:hypothetical protein
MMNTVRKTPGLLPAAIGLALLSGCGQPHNEALVRNAAEATAAVKRYCADCHNDLDWMGELSFRGLDAANVNADPATWERIVRKLRTRTMPPQDAIRPEAETYETWATVLESELDRSAVPPAGSPGLRRLNRAEYKNAIRDLLALDVDASTLLPPDDSAFGFDNNGDLLGFSPALLERYLTAADYVSALALGDPATAAGAKTYYVSGDESQSLHREGLPLGTVGGFAAEHTFALDAEYEFSIALLRNNLDVIRGLEHPHQLEIAVDGERVLLEAVGGPADARPGPEEGGTVNEHSDAIDARLRVRVPVKAGPRVVTAAFVRKIGASPNRLRPFERSSAGTYDGTGRPHVKTLTITGPLDPTGSGDTPSRARILSCTPAEASDERRCAEEILTTLARRAYRRPVTESDLARLMPFFEEGRANGGFESGIQLSLRRILASPSFAFRLEADSEDAAAGTSVPVTDVELASRLSFFLWSSIPDDELLEVAAGGKLSEQKVLEAQVRRMLADPKSAALAENFAGQWLHLRNLANIRPNSDEFPDFDNNLRQAFRREAELFFASIISENRSVLDLMTANYTYVDERLARHYGIRNVYGSRFRRVELPAELTVRQGLLGKGGVLMATSHADRTAPSLRGKFLLENLVGSPPPAPPANVPALESELSAAPQTMRERLAAHRENPSCAGCHQLIDPLGFAMENFDAIGAWRTHDAGRAVDATGVLFDGTTVDGALGLREALLRDPHVFVGTFTEKMLTYALGRGLQHYDQPLVRKILRDTEQDGYRSTAIVLAIINSAQFRTRTKAAGGV